MAKLYEMARYIRSKNAGPFWLTVDIFFDEEETFEKVKNAPELNPQTVSHLYGIPAENVKMFYLKDLKVIKISFPRFAPQGSPGERDMHGGQQYTLLSNLEITL